MSSELEGAGARACWFVGASYGNEDQSPRFIEQEIWENGYYDKYLDMVKAVQPGDHIAIKSTYVRKNDVPFDNRGEVVSVMAIKAVGTVTENFGDGRTLRVKWTPLTPPREWYFYTGRTTVWRVLPGDWKTDALIAFAFRNVPQDIGRFRNAPFWRERFGDNISDAKHFEWTKFYEAVATKLLAFKDRRSELVADIHAFASKLDGASNLQDQFFDGSRGPLKDICPFTTMGIFNRGITDANRKAIALELANFLGVSEAVPDSFDGIPLLNNQKSWFFGYEKNRKADDIDLLWKVFGEALQFADSGNEEARTDFALAYDNVASRWGVGWNLTMGLFWIRPWSFATLESQSQKYIVNRLDIEIERHGPKGRCSARDYLKILDTLSSRFQEDAFPVHSFPELSLAAVNYKDTSTPEEPFNAAPIDDEIDPGEMPEAITPLAPIVPYSIDNIVADGCFLPRPRLVEILECLRSKKNLILQGPPGTGKSWLAKRLAYGLMGQRDESKVRAVQFHPNLSYEDFIRGWRPSGNGKLTLVNGPFLEMVKAAGRNPAEKHVVVIEEINRGNPAQIFGEMLTLLEADKRTPNEALELCYRLHGNERVFIPDNLYVIGTMNIADRSLALVDLALRRRFAFVELEPTLGEPWHNWVHTKSGIDKGFLTEIAERINNLNSVIAADTSLGLQFRVGHSYVTPHFSDPIKDARAWFRQVVLTEIGPLLDEYWFDAPKSSQKARQQLLEGF